MSTVTNCPICNSELKTRVTKYICSKSNNPDCQFEGYPKNYDKLSNEEKDNFNNEKIKPLLKNKPTTTSNSTTKSISNPIKSEEPIRLSPRKDYCPICKTEMTIQRGKKACKNESCAFEYPRDFDNWDFAKKLEYIEKFKAENQTGSDSPNIPTVRRKIQSTAELEQAIQDKVTDLDILYGEYILEKSIQIDYRVRISGIDQTPKFICKVPNQSVFEYTGDDLYLLNLSFEQSKDILLANAIWDIQKGKIEISKCSFSNAIQNDNNEENMISAIKVSGEVEGIIENNRFKNNTNGVVISRKSTIHILKNTFEQDNFEIKSYGISVKGKATPLIEKNQFASIKYGIKIENEANPQILDNAIQEAVIGFILDDNANAQIQKNTIQESKHCGIEIRKESSPTIQDNYLIKNKKGINLKDDSSPTIQQNYFDQNEDVSIEVEDNAQGDFTNNLIQHTKNAFILKGKSRSKLNENKIQGCSDYAIKIEETASPKYLKDNLIHHNNGTGIFISTEYLQEESSEPVIIENNLIQFNQKCGILIEKFSHVNLKDNQIRRNTEQGILCRSTISIDQNNKIDRISTFEKNLIEEHTVGVQIENDAKINIINNKISYNIDGLVIKHKVQATIKHNLIKYQYNNGIDIQNDSKVELLENEISFNLGTGVSYNANTSEKSNTICFNHSDESKIPSSFKLFKLSTSSTQFTQNAVKNVKESVKISSNIYQGKLNKDIATETDNGIQFVYLDEVDKNILIATEDCELIQYSSQGVELNKLKTRVSSILSVQSIDNSLLVLGDDTCKIYDNLSSKERASYDEISNIIGASISQENIIAIGFNENRKGKVRFLDKSFTKLSIINEKNFDFEIKDLLFINKHTLLVADGRSLKWIFLNSNISKSISFEFTLNTIAHHAEKNLIAIAGRFNVIYIINSQTLNIEKQITESVREFSKILFSHDGNYLYCLAKDSEEIIILNINEEQPRKINQEANIFDENIINSFAVSNNSNECITVSDQGFIIYKLQ